MPDAYAFLRALTIVLAVAGAMTIVCHRLRQPVVLGYIVAGLVIGPHVPIPLVADAHIVHTLSELGVILLMFSLGLEFSLRQLVRVAPTAGVAAVIQCGVMVFLGFIVGQAFGWTTLESLFTGAIIAISSTTIIAKAFDDQGVKGRLRELVVGILIVEDLIAVLLMAALTAIAQGSGLSPEALAETSGRLLGFLAALVVVGLLIVPRLVRAVVRLGSAETTLVTAVGVCFGVALLAHAAGYSVALGAFIAGSLVAESGEAKTVEHLVHPLRDLFAAIFFVSVGMLIDPALVADHALAVAVLFAVVIAGKVLSVSFGAFLTGAGTRDSVAAGMSLAQIGEFSFIIAALGASLGATGDFLYPVAIAVAALTTLTTPGMIRRAGAVASFVDRKLPRPLQTLSALHASWLERLRRAPDRPEASRRTRLLIGFLVLDVVLVSALVIAASRVASTPVIAGAVALGVLLAADLYRIVRRLGVLLAERALPRGRDGARDPSVVPRRVLVLLVQLGCVVAAGVTIVAVTQPFVPGPHAALILLVVVVVLAAALWRSAVDLEGHVRAGAELVVEVLARQTAQPSGGGHAGAGEGLKLVHELLPGIGEPASIALAQGSPAVGRSLAELDLRGVTGATVLAITRGADRVLVPSAGERLHAGDVLALAGSQEAIAAASELLEPRASPPPPRPAPPPRSP